MVRIGSLLLSQAAEYVGVSRATIQNWIVSGLIAFESLPGRGDGTHKFRLIRKTDLDAFLDGNYHQPKESGKPENREKLTLLPKVS